MARGILLLEPAAAPPVLHILLREMPLIAPRMPRLRCTIMVAAAVLSLGFRWKRQSAAAATIPTAAAQHASAEATLAHVLSPALGFSGGGAGDGPCAELLACLSEHYLATVREVRAAASTWALFRARHYRRINSKLTTSPRESTAALVTAAGNLCLSM